MKGDQAALLDGLVRYKTTTPDFRQALHLL